MRLIYLHREFENPNSGVNKKINSQMTHLSNLGVDCEKFSVFNGDNSHFQTDPHATVPKPAPSSKIHNIIGILRRESLVNTALSNKLPLLTKEDILYMRTPYPFRVIAKRFKEPRACKIVIEYQTIEPLEYKLKGNFWYLLLDLLFGNSIRKHSDAIIGVTDEITCYQLKR